MEKEVDKKVSKFRKGKVVHLGWSSQCSGTGLGSNGRKGASLLAGLHSGRAEPTAWVVVIALFLLDMW